MANETESASQPANEMVDKNDFFMWASMGDLTTESIKQLWSMATYKMSLGPQARVLLKNLILYYRRRTREMNKCDRTKHLTGNCSKFPGLCSRATGEIAVRLEDELEYGNEGGMLEEITDAMAERTLTPDYGPSGVHSSSSSTEHPHSESEQEEQYYPESPSYSPTRDDEEENSCLQPGQPVTGENPRKRAFPRDHRPAPAPKGTEDEISDAVHEFSPYINSRPLNELLALQIAVQKAIQLQSANPSNKETRAQTPPHFVVTPISPLQLVTNPHLASNPPNEENDTRPAPPLPVPAPSYSFLTSPMMYAPTSPMFSPTAMNGQFQFADQSSRQRESSGFPMYQPHSPADHSITHPPGSSITSCQQPMSPLGIKEPSGFPMYQPRSNADHSITYTSCSSSRPSTPTNEQPSSPLGPSITYPPSCYSRPTTPSDQQGSIQSMYQEFAPRSPGGTNENMAPSCAFCEEMHQSEHCVKYKTYAQRKERREQLGLCWICLNVCEMGGCDPKKKECRKRKKKMCPDCDRHVSHVAFCVYSCRMVNDDD